MQEYVITVKPETISPYFYGEFITTTVAFFTVNIFVNLYLLWFTDNLHCPENTTT